MKSGKSGIGNALKTLMGGLSLMASVAASGAEQAQVPEVEEIPSVVRLMSADQYSNSIHYILGTDIKSPGGLSPLRRVDGLSGVGASTALVAAGTFNNFDAAAASIASQAVDEVHRKSLVKCRPADEHGPDDRCARQFFAEVGHLMFRRPVSAQRLAVYVNAARLVATQQHDFYVGLEYSLAGMMVAPEFIYFVEKVEQDPEHPGHSRLDGASKAMRLSLLLWNSSPDLELLRAAESGELHTKRGVAHQVDRMLGSPGNIETGTREFFNDMLQLDVFSDLVKDPFIYPAFTGKVASDAKEQILKMVVDQLITRDGDYRDLFTTRHIFLTQALTSIYRIPVSVAGSLGWSPYDLPEGDPRNGILTQIGFLAVNAHPGRSSATRRGRALRENIMCQKVPDPPPNVDFSAIETPDPKIRTARERLDIHRTNPVCAGCHKITDPIGLSLENFDGAGQFRTEEKGAPIDASGMLNGKNFTDAKGLGQAVHDDPAVSSCLVKRLFEYGVGRKVTAQDKPDLVDLTKQFADAKYRYRSLLRTMALSDAFFRTSSRADVLSASVRELEHDYSAGKGSNHVSD